ncbi:DNA repair REX1-B-domain-containing protein [Sporodiniella umbellata]|nr:DNA repair REX1-B-domain-containing protein [Sporodiniella umbellata]
MSNPTLEQNELLSKQLQSIFKSQNTRNELYQEFDIAFKDYVKGSCPADQYHSICRIVTEGFQEVSHEIQTIEKSLSNSMLARIVRDLQEAERTKLQETVQIQILTIQSKETDKDYDETIHNHQEKLKETLEKIQDTMDELREEMAGLASLVC